MFEIFSFHLSHIRILRTFKCDKTRNDVFINGNCNGGTKLNEYYKDKFRKTTGTDTQIQN